jgi:hypothetical protein
MEMCHPNVVDHTNTLSIKVGDSDIGRKDYLLKVNYRSRPANDEARDG